MMRKQTKDRIGFNQASALGAVGTSWEDFWARSLAVVAAAEKMARPEIQYDARPEPVCLGLTP
jgi:hypothetical protein